ncbi:hypothetical protein BJV82DRAFT_608060 [Fennellomyces sp. T-0311]|nr:hypothetical protein BJV82DRAFT_608060 [Fennellomyces sp. T-0311]
MSTSSRSTPLPTFTDTAMLDLANDPALALSALGATTSEAYCLAKPKAASADARHECGTGLLPITTSPHMGIGTSPTAAWQLLLYYHQQLLFPPLVKDDVFLGPADNESVITTNSSSDGNAPSVGNWAPTPCLSPVTSPSDFLCNEPLFDGIGDLQQQQQQQQQQDESHNEETKPDASASTPNLDWYEFTKEDDGHTSSVLTLPTPSPTASENEASLFDDENIALDFSSDDDDEDDDGNTNDMNNTHDDDEEYSAPAERSLKRKRSQSIDSITSCDESEEEEESAPVLQRLHRLRLSESTKRKNKAKPVAKRRTKRHPGRRGARPKTIACPAYQTDVDQDDGVHRTIFERLTHAGIDWCRYCGTTEGVNWRPGPWGKRTLCNKHGCDYKGYGIASRLPRLDLSAFIHERLEDRRRPVVQQFCVVCQGPESNSDNKLVPCEGGCSRAYHQLCRIPAITPTAYQDQQWCCSTVCRENRKRNKVGPYDS